MRAPSGGLLLGVGLAVLPAWAAPENEKPSEKPATPATVTVPSTASEAAPPATPKVRYENDKVSVEARDADLGEVLKALAKASGADLVGAPRAGGPVTITLEQTPISEALERLVGAQNFTLKYDENAKLKTIELRGGQEAAQRPKADAAPTAEGNTTPPKWMAFWQAVFKQPIDPIQLTGDLKKAIGKDEVGWDYLANTAIASQDPKTRAESVKALLKALDDDPERKAAVFASLDAMTDEELANFVRKTAHYRAEDVVRNALRESNDGEVRTRARKVLHELRKIPYHGPLTPMH